jgi:hypothetical protein
MTTRKTTPDLVTLGIDLGRSEARLYDGETLITLPAILGGPVATIRRGSSQVIDETLDTHLTVKLGAKTYSVGRYALEQPYHLPLNDLDLFADDLNLVMLLAMLGLYSRQQGFEGTPKFKLCIGLPVALSRRTDYVETHLRAWERLHTFDLSGKPMAVDIAQIDVIPQPVGAVYAGLLAGQLDYAPDENIGVIDPGHLTTDWVVVRLPNELSNYSGQSTAAAGLRLTDAVANYLSDQGIMRQDPVALMEAAASGQYVHNGTTYTIPAEIIDELVEMMALQVALTVKQSWRDLSIDRMLLVGGFGRLLYPHLTQHPYFRDLQIAQDHRYFNVKGAYEYAIAAPPREGLTGATAPVSAAAQTKEAPVREAKVKQAPVSAAAHASETPSAKPEGVEPQVGEPSVEVEA